MPIELKQSRRDIDSFDITFSGETGTIQFYPNEMTIDWGEDLGKAGEDVSESLRLISEVLHDWDINENGEKVPVSEDGLRTLPNALLERIMEGCQREAAKRAVLVTPRGERRRRGHGGIGSLMDGVFGSVREVVEDEERRRREEDDERNE